MPTTSQCPQDRARKNVPINSQHCGYPKEDSTMTATDMSVNVDGENFRRTNPWKKQLSVITASESGESVLFIHEVLIGSLSLIQQPWTLYVHVRFNWTKFVYAHTQTYPYARVFKKKMSWIRKGEGHERRWRGKRSFKRDIWCSQKVN